jgi:hypothetical protein
MKMGLFSALAFASTCGQPSPSSKWVPPASSAVTLIAAVRQNVRKLIARIDFVGFGFNMRLSGRCGSRRLVVEFESGLGVFQFVGITPGIPGGESVPLR